MERFVSRQSLSWALTGAVLALLTVSSVGCKGLFSTVAYLVKGTNVDAEYDGLKHHKVAVIVRPPAGASADAHYGARELAQKIGEHLQRNVRGIKVVEQQEVERWMDDLNNLEQDDYRAAGRALKADQVVAVELEEFRLNNNSTSLYTGRCGYRIVVYDLKDKAGQIVYEHTPLEATVYPPNHGIPIGEKTRAGFRRIFVGALAEEIAQRFYPHDSTVHFARDSATLEHH